MRREELVGEALTYGLAAADGFTCDHLRAVLRSIREAQVGDGTKTSKEDYVPGLHKMKKEELQKILKDRGVPFDPDETNPTLRQKIKGYDPADAASSPHGTTTCGEITAEDVIRFGKYSSRQETWTYRDVFKKDWGYCRWAVLQYEEGRAAALLARFAKWCKAHGVPPAPKDEQAFTHTQVMNCTVKIDQDLLWTEAWQDNRKGETTTRQRPSPVDPVRTGAAYDMSTPPIAQDAKAKLAHDKALLCSMVSEADPETLNKMRDILCMMHQVPERRARSHEDAPSGSTRRPRPLEPHEMDDREPISPTRPAPPDEDFGFEKLCDAMLPPSKSEWAAMLQSRGAASSAQ